MIFFNAASFAPAHRNTPFIASSFTSGYLALMMRNSLGPAVLAIGLCQVACTADLDGEETTGATTALSTLSEAETGPSTSGESEGGETTASGDGDVDTQPGDGNTGTGQGDGDTGTGMGDTGMASTTHYTPIDNGRCGFQTIPSGTSPHGRIVALPTWVFGGAQWCGAFIELDSSTGNTFESCGGVTGATLKVMVSDECPEDTNQEHCYDGAWHFDLSQPAFSDMADLSCGVLNDISWQLVEGTHSGNVKVRNKDGINQWWYSLYVLDHNYAITQVELRATGEDWVPATRSDTNFWTLESAAGLVPPIDVRITDIHGQVIGGEDVVANFNENAVFDVGSQFPGGMGGGGPLGGSW